MRKVLGIASVFIMMLSVAAFANTFGVEESVLAAGAVDVEGCEEIALTYDVDTPNPLEQTDTGDGTVTSVTVHGGDDCRYDAGGRDFAAGVEGQAEFSLVAPIVEVVLYDDGDAILTQGEASFLATGGSGGNGTEVAMDDNDVLVTAVKGVNVLIYDRDAPEAP